MAKLSILKPATPAVVTAPNIIKLVWMGLVCGLPPGIAPGPELLLGPGLLLGRVELDGAGVGHVLGLGVGEGVGHVDGWGVGVGQEDGAGVGGGVPTATHEACNTVFPVISSGGLTR